MPRRCAMLMAGMIALAATMCLAQDAPGVPDSVLAELRPGEQLPAGTYTEALSWEAEDASHNTGRLVEDAEASNGLAWEVAPDQDVGGTMLFGPYLETEPGDYVAFFRVKLLEAAEDTVGQLDACVAYAQGILAADDLVGASLPAGRWAVVPLGFRYSGGKLECRFTWYGDVPLRMDRVMLFRLEGVDPSRPGWRVPEAVPSGLPRDLAYYTEPRPFLEVFPQSAPPARELVVCDLRRQRADMRLLVLSLQGLVNRTQPRIYCLYALNDDRWLQHLLDRGWVESTRSATPAELVAEFHDSFQGAVIVDPQLPASKNVATMLAGVRGCVVASARLAQELDLPVVEDLRGRWRTSAEAYRWAFDNLWPELNHHLIACSWPEHLGLRDYLVQHKVFIFWLSGPLDGAKPYASPDAEVRLMEELLARMPVNIPTMSYPFAGKDVGMGEGPGVTLLAEFGKYLVGSIDSTNLSVHSGVPVGELRQKPAPPTPELDPSKVYLSFIISDGDNLPVVTLHNFPQLWHDEIRGSFPVGWTLSPSAGLLIPDVVDYYYSTATPNDAFLGAVSGVGYTYPDVYGKRYREPDRQRVLDEFLDQTATYMQRTDLRSLWIMGASRPEIIRRYAERIPFLEALFPDYGRRVVSGEEAAYPTANNVPVFHAVTGWRMDATREERIGDMISELQRMTPKRRPAFLHAFVLNWFADLPMLKAVLDGLGPEYVAVRPDHLAALWRQQMAREQIVARFPQLVPALEGQPVVLEGTVRNMSAEKLEVGVRVAGGLDRVGVDPDRFELEPAGEAVVRVSGVPRAGVVELELSGDFGTRTGSVALRLARGAELASPVPDADRLVPVTVLEAAALAHRFGFSQADSEADAEKAWAATAGETEPGHIVFGPYAPLEPGRYVALFRVKRTDDGAGPLLVLDTCVGGGAPQTGVREVSAEELPVGQYRLLPVAFDHPGGPYETRVLWSGAASVAVDTISLWRVAE